MKWKLCYREINSTFFHLNESRGKLDVLCGTVETGALSQRPAPGCSHGLAQAPQRRGWAAVPLLESPDSLHPLSAGHLAPVLGGKGLRPPSPAGATALGEPTSAPSLETVKRNLLSQEKQPDHHAP